MNSNKRTAQDAYAGEYHFYFNFSAKWDNGSGTKQTGNYKSLDGNVFKGSVGSVSVNWTRDDGGSWSGSTSVNTLTGDASCTFYSGCTVWELRKSFYCELTRSHSSKSGFYASISTDFNVGANGSFGALVWESSSGYYNVTFKPRTYNIYFYSNGGVFPDGTTSKNGQEVFYENYAVMNDIPVPTKIGYAFAGWYTSPTGGTRIYSNTCFNNNSYTSLYAHWTPRPYKIYFDQTKGTGGLASITVTYDQMVPSIAEYPFPTRNGYTFEGYYDKDYELDPTGTQYYDKNGNGLVVYKIAGDMYWAYARWEPKKIAITLDNQGADTAGSPMVYYKFDTEEYFKTCTLDANNERVLSDKISNIVTPTRTGYTFKGYYTEPEGAGTKYIDANGNFVNNLYSSVYDDSTLYACWDENSYKIRFHPNGGEGEMYDSEDILFTEPYTLPKNEFYFKNYLFKGWSLLSYGNVEYLDEATVSNLSPDEGGVVIFYAVWESTWATKAIKPEGSGLQNAPYLISSPENLSWLANQIENGSSDLSGYFKQTANINLNGTTWLPIGNQNKKFIGSYDGNNYAITNIRTGQNKNANGSYLNSYQGLFGHVSNATISNVNIMSGTIYGREYVGGLVGKSNSSTMSGNITYITVNASQYAGGMIGSDSSSIISNCYTKSTITGVNYLGGFVGSGNSSQIDGCGVDFTVTAKNSVSNKIAIFSGNAQNTKISNCFGRTVNEEKFYFGSATVTDSLYEAGSAKYYYNGTFSNWVISTTLIPLPSGLSWLATGGTKVGSAGQIAGLGYVLVS